MHPTKEQQSSAELCEEQKAVLALYCLEGVGAATLGALKKAFGSISEVLYSPAEKVTPFFRDEATRQRYRQMQNPWSLADWCWERMDKIQGRILFAGQADWPLNSIDSRSPPLLFVRGQPAMTSCFAGKRVAIVGARRVDIYGEKITSFFAGHLARGGCTIISGGAIGVDAIAHRAALNVSGSTIAVLGTGIDVTYPMDNKNLFSEIIAKGGALVSQFPPGVMALRKNFQIRNRLIAGLSDAVLVTRAGSNSGSLGTAQYAQEIGRPVFAIPGNITDELSVGTNGMLERKQARLANGVSSLEEALGWRVTGNTPVSRPASPDGNQNKANNTPNGTSNERLSDRPEEEVPSELRPVWKALGRQPIQFEQLLEKCSLSVAGLTQALVQLELIGLCEERLGKIFIRR